MIKYDGNRIMFDGCYKDSMLNGKGWIFIHGNCVLEGNWIDNELHGKCRYWYPDG